MSNCPFEFGERLPTLTASRVRLRWLNGDDVPALLAIFGDARVMRYWSRSPFADLEDARDYLGKIHTCFCE